ncbi:MAG: hypothetical protein ACXACP_13320, partial [Candidatus Hodarchaeales archaeon]
EEKESIRIIDPLKLVESIEQIETEFVILEEEKDKEIMNLEEQILENRRKEASLKGEINDISVKLSESEKSREARLQDKSTILNKHNVIVEEINSLKAKILNLETEIDQIERENKDITISLEGD